MNFMFNTFQVHRSPITNREDRRTQNFGGLLRNLMRISCAWLRPMHVVRRVFGQQNSSCANYDRLGVELGCEALNSWSQVSTHDPWGDWQSPNNNKGSWVEGEGKGAMWERTNSANWKQARRSSLHGSATSYHPLAMSAPAGRCPAEHKRREMASLFSLTFLDQATHTSNARIQSHVQSVENKQTTPWFSSLSPPPLITLCKLRLLWTFFLSVSLSPLPRFTSSCLHLVNPQTNPHYQPPLKYPKVYDGR